jgi:hypothetical protein
VKIGLQEASAHDHLREMDIPKSDRSSSDPVVSREETPLGYPLAGMRITLKCFVDLRFGKGTFQLTLKTRGFGPKLVQSDQTKRMADRLRESAFLFPD